MKNIAIFSSGSGTNAENIIKYFQMSSEIRVKLVLSDKKGAYVHKRAANLGIKSIFFAKSEFYESDRILDILKDYSIDFVVLAGFLRLVPKKIIDFYLGRIINIHPALLPKYGGKGMYGSNVHKTVISARDNESGITIHHVNKQYDEGDIIFQAKCPVLKSDTPDSLAKKIHMLEYEHFPKVIEQEIEKIL